jgi:prephenate dehydrogenase
MMFQKVAIIGVGLIGGSLAAALKAQGLAAQIVGIGRSQATLDEALSLGLIDAASTDVAAVSGCDLIVLCAPVAQTQPLLVAMKPHLAPDAVITDAGSTKQDVVAAAKAALGGEHTDLIANFVPAHPIAGKAQHGPAAADAALYQGKRVVITPLAENKPECVASVQALWQAVGAQVSFMSPVQHDAVFSAVSHLPHLLAYALVAQIANAEDASTKLGYAGGGFRDFTRIAASSPEMWRDIFAANKTALLKDLRDYQRMLGQLEMLLVTDNHSALEKMIAKAANVRQNWNTAGKIEGTTEAITEGKTE